MSSTITRVLVFDTETNGLLPKRDPATKLPIINEYPYILQLSFIVYNVKTHAIEQTFNNYIKVNNDVVINDKITEITGITKDTCDKKGIPIVNALYEFYHAYMSCDRVIAHNLNFDKNMIELEILRNYECLRTIPDSPFLFNDMFNSVNNVDTYCTMQKTRKFCNITINGKYGPYTKAPRMCELHDKLFNFVPENLHDAMVDTMTCLKCYLKFEHDITMEPVVDDYLKSGIKYDTSI
jgi:DNA polymerase-3 subunit epsilon